MSLDPDEEVSRSTSPKMRSDTSKDVSALIAEMDALRESMQTAEAAGLPMDAKNECRMSILESLVRELQMKMLLQIKMKISDDVS